MSANTAAAVMFEPVSKWSSGNYHVFPGQGGRPVGHVYKAEGGGWEARGYGVGGIHQGRTRQAAALALLAAVEKAEAAPAPAAPVETPAAPVVSLEEGEKGYNIVIGEGEGRHVLGFVTRLYTGTGKKNGWRAVGLGPTFDGKGRAFDARRRYLAVEALLKAAGLAA